MAARWAWLQGERVSREAKDADYHDVIAKEYDRVVVRPREYPNDVLFAPIARVVRPGRAMLDLGCGTGHMLLRFRDRFAEATGVDHSRGMIEVARRNVQERGLAEVRFVQGDVFEFVRDCRERFDLVSCVGVLHHLDPARLGEVLGKLGALCAPGGHVVIAEPIAVDVARQPEELVAWGRQSLGARIGYSMHAEEPDEGPIAEALLRGAIAQGGLEVRAESRMWEMSAATEHPGWLERYRIRRLIRRHGASGNVLAMALAPRGG